jgi:hypothetical protein
VVSGLKLPPNARYARSISYHLVNEYIYLLKRLGSLVFCNLGHDLLCKLIYQPSSEAVCHRPKTTTTVYLAVVPELEIDMRGLGQLLDSVVSAFAKICLL